MSRDAGRPAPASPPAPRGYLFDVDGVLHVGMRPIPGAADVLSRLEREGIPYRLLTNTTTASRASLAAALRGIGLPVADDHLITAPVATAAYLQRTRPGARCYLLAKGDVAEDFRDAGLTPVGLDGTPAADVVVVGGAEDEFTYARMNHAYRLLLGGAALVAMHRNAAWRTAGGMSLDGGPFVLALERAAGVRAVVIGKPALPFFRQGLRSLRTSGFPGLRALPALAASAVAMVGDDAHNDLRPAARLGLRTILVRTGKPVGPAEAALADRVIASVADVL